MRSTRGRCGRNLDRVEGLLVSILEELQDMNRILRAAPSFCGGSGTETVPGTSSILILWKQAYADDDVFVRSVTAYSPVALAAQRASGEERDWHALCLARKVSEIIQRMPVNAFEVQNRLAPGTIQRRCALMVGKNPTQILRDQKLTNRLQVSFGGMEES